MVMSRTIQIRTTKQQYDQIRSLAEARGFESLSSYLRHMALHQDLITQQKIAEIHQHIVAQQPIHKYKANQSNKTH